MNFLKIKPTCVIIADLEQDTEEGDAFGSGNGLDEFDEPRIEPGDVLDDEQGQQQPHPSAETDVDAAQQIGQQHGASVRFGGQPVTELGPNCLIRTQLSPGRELMNGSADQGSNASDPN